MLLDFLPRCEPWQCGCFPVDSPFVEFREIRDSDDRLVPAVAQLMVAGLALVLKTLKVVDNPDSVLVWTGRSCLAWWRIRPIGHSF